MLSGIRLIIITKKNIIKRLRCVAALRWVQYSMRTKQKKSIVYFLTLTKSKCINLYMYACWMCVYVCVYACVDTRNYCIILYRIWRTWLCFMVNLCIHVTKMKWIKKKNESTTIKTIQQKLRLFAIFKFTRTWSRFRRRWISSESIGFIGVNDLIVIYRVT